MKLLARSFRDAGLEVIYTGLWQTSQATVYAALQEDVDVIGVSLHSAAHMDIMSEVLQYQKQFGIEDIPTVLGGIIPAADYQPLKQMGVAEVFNPGSSMSNILSTLQKLADHRPKPPLPQLLDGFRSGQMKSVARLITHIQRRSAADFSMSDLSSTTGTPSRVIGITGSPGVGKSSFIAKLARMLRSRGERVAVVAVDPTSPLTGGALLGDRLRMMGQEPDNGFFVRSVASASEQGGVGPKVADIISLLRGYGFQTILIETVGSGQGDTAILNITRNILLLLMPSSGDDIQFAKAGIMEIASGYVINKSDLPGADVTHNHLLEAVGGDRPVWQVSALHDRGLDQVADWVQKIALQ
ncbi:MAG: Fused isobutyryl-CoA mutase [Phycisphaerae bacterium]|nr:Fused isobutyryl-CoA mutase [Phycisphaerae bacterium]